MQTHPLAAGRTGTALRRAVRFAALTLALLLCLFFASCEKEVETSAPVAPDQVITDDGQTSAPEPVPAPVNPLTGLRERVDYLPARPIAVMINNLKKATPPRGLSQYDGAIEVLAEGDIDRIIAIFYDYASIPELGSVRSARDYYLKLVRPLDPIILHYGGSDAAYIYIKKNKLDTLNGMEGEVDELLYWRDKQRIKQAGYEHSVFTSGEKIAHTIETLSRRTETEKTQPFFLFAPEGEAISAGSLGGEKITVPFSSYIEPVFVYDAERGCYLRSQYGAPHVDEKNGEQITADNLFVLFAPHREVGDQAGHIEVTTTGSGKGLYFQGGTGRAVTWSRAGETDFFEFADEAGEPLAVQRGKVWICMVKPSAEVRYEGGVQEESQE